MTPNSAPEDHKNPIKKITILLAGNHSVVRQGLRLLLEKQTDLEIVGERFKRPGNSARGGQTKARCADR